MIIKIVSLFLVGMVVLAMFGRLKVPKLKFRNGKKCKKCGAPLINNSICVCEE